MVDPQLQGLKWIKNKYGDDLIILRLDQKGYLDKIEQAIVYGETVLLENIAETIDAVLDPILGRVLIKKGKYVVIDLYPLVENTRLNQSMKLSRSLIH